jgi:Neurotransmitter-gated ion-channel ligand binding domain/Neurotransmitter-gated ion-channel transmembrane region
VSGRQKYASVHKQVNPRLPRWIAMAIALLPVLFFIAGRAFAASAPDSEAANSLLEPPGSRTKPGPVTIEMRVINISDIDEVGQHFKMVGYLVAHWDDARLAFTPSGPEDSYHLYSAGQVWCPHFDFVNGIVPHSSSDVTIRAFPDGTVRYSARSSADLSNTFNLRKFPFDTETLEILIHPSMAEAESVDYELPRGNALSAEPRVYSELAQWILAGMSSSVQRIPGLSDESISEVRFAISIVRRYNFYIWKVFLPLTIMVILSWTVFWVDPSELSAQATISATTILTVIAFAFAIQANLPKVSYLTYIDVFFLICYLFVFLTALEIVAAHMAGRSGRIIHARRLNRISRTSAVRVLVSCARTRNHIWTQPGKITVGHHPLRPPWRWPQVTRCPRPPPAAGSVGSRARSGPAVSSSRARTAARRRRTDRIARPSAR